jgi:hypothetical protein
VDGVGHTGAKRESHRQEKHERAGNKGRPSKLTDQLREKFCIYAGMSGSIETAIKLTGLGRATYYRWSRSVRDGRGSLLQNNFIRAAEAACADIKLRCEQRLRNAVKRAGGLSRGGWGENIQTSMGSAVSGSSPIERVKTNPRGAGRR